MQIHKLTLLAIATCSIGCQSVLTDIRDGRKYKTVKVNGTVWMAENLKYQMAGAEPYNRVRENAERFGLVYQWQTVTKACPTGWRLPTVNELTALMLKYGKISYGDDSSDFRNLFGPYAPQETAATYRNLVSDKAMNFPEVGPNKVDTHRALIWTSEPLEGDAAYAIYWRAIDENIEHESVHFSTYWKDHFMGFCRCVKE